MSSVQAKMARRLAAGITCGGAVAILVLILAPESGKRALLLKPDRPSGRAALPSSTVTARPPVRNIEPKRNGGIETFKFIPSPAEAACAEPPAAIPGKEGFSFAHNQGHYTADITASGLSIRFGDSATPSLTAPLALTLKSPGETAGNSPQRHKETIEIQRGPLTEWYRNSLKGVEQGFTIQEPPAHGQGSGIRLELATSGTWTAIADASDTSIRFQDKASGAEVRYGNLMAFDASGKKLPARMEPLADGAGVAIHASDLGAVYPITVDPLLTVLTLTGIASPGAYTFGPQDPVILGDTLNFTLKSSAGSSSFGLWAVPLATNDDAKRLFDGSFSTSSSLAGMMSGALGNSLFFSNTSGSLYSFELGGAAPVIFPAAAKGGGPFLAIQDGFGYYLRNDGLWRTDGTGAGTTKVRDLAGTPNPEALMIGGTLYYTYTDYTPSGASEKLAFSSSSFGTVFGGAGSTLRSALTLEGKILFTASAGIYATDGTAAGTILLAAGASMESATLAGSWIYFRKDGRLWKTNGTPGATGVVSDAVTMTGSAVESGGSIYFNGADGALTSVWRSDGTEAGTTVFRTSAKIASAGGDGFFYLLVTTAAEGEEIWASNGTPEGTVLLRDITAGASSSGYDSFRHAGRQLLFRAGGQLWRSNGTPEGTIPLFDGYTPESSASSIANITPAGSKVFFTAYRAEHGVELWMADPASRTAFEVADIYPGTLGSNPYQLQAFGDGTVLFFATHPDTGTELWKSDGTPTGTVLVKDLSPFTTPKPTKIMISGGTAWFVAADGAGNMSLCRTDGTSAGTTAVRTAVTWQQTAPSSLVAFGQGVAFIARSENSASKSQIWVSDGTGPGTLPVDQAALNLASGSVLLASGDKLFVSAYEASPTPGSGGGPSFWAASGNPPVFHKFRSTPAGTYSAKLHFARDGFAYYSVQADRIFNAVLYRTDGSSEGTAMPLNGQVDTISQAGGTIFIEDLTYLSPTPPSDVNSRLYAFNPDNPTDTSIDFSTETHQPKIGNPVISSGGSNLTYFNAVCVGNWAFFPSGPNSLWVSDGRNAGTSQVPDAGDKPSNLTAGQDCLYYVTSHPVYGTQLRMIRMTADLAVKASPSEGGTVTGALTGVSQPGLKSIAASPAEGYYFSHWEGAGVSEPNTPSTTVNMVVSSVEVTAVFKPISPVLKVWAEEYGLSGSDSEPFADPAGDGVANLLKYGFNLSPLIPATTLNASATDRGLPAISLESTPEGKVLRFEFVRRKSGAVTYQAEISTDLRLWVPATSPAVTQSLNADWEKVVISHPVPLGTSNYFGRLRLDLP